MINKAAAYKLLAVEGALTAAAAGLLWIALDPVTAYSAACGGAAFIAPQAVFARFAFRHSAADSPALALRWFYLGEAAKLALTALLFALIITHVSPLRIAALILTFAAMLFINLFGLARLSK